MCRRSVAAPVEEGETLGKIVYRLEGETIPGVSGHRGGECPGERFFHMLFLYQKPFLPEWTE